MAKKRNYLALDPERARVWREAWDLLLTDQYTLEQICQELHNRGFTRRSGKPWVWVDERSGIKKFAISHLHQTFHMPFYAGWVISQEYGIKRGEVRGQWEPIISDEEFDRGVEILKRHDEGKVRIKRHVYLLSGILQMEIYGEKGQRCIKVHGSTPTGRNRSYSYYVATERIDGIQHTIAVEEVDEQVIGLLGDVQVGAELLPSIRLLYREHLAKLKGPSVHDLLASLHQRIERLHAEEAALARLYAQGKLSDQNYDSLYREWQAKLFEAQQELNRLQKGSREAIDDLDQALILLHRAPTLFERLEKKLQRRLLQILFKRIIIDTHGKVVDVDLHPPFHYLTALARAPDGASNHSEDGSGSSKIQPAQFVSSRITIWPNDDIDQFLEMVRFEQRNKYEALKEQLSIRF